MLLYLERWVEEVVSSEALVQKMEVAPSVRGRNDVIRSLDLGLHQGGIVEMQVTLTTFIFSPDMAQSRLLDSSDRSSDHYLGFRC